MNRFYAVHGYIHIKPNLLLKLRYFVNFLLIILMYYFKFLKFILHIYFKIIPVFGISDKLVVGLCNENKVNIPQVKCHLEASRC